MHRLEFLLSTAMSVDHANIDDNTGRLRMCVSANRHQPDLLEWLFVVKFCRAMRSMPEELLTLAVDALH